MNKLKKMSLVIISIVILFSIIFYTFNYNHWIGIDENEDIGFKNRFFNRLYFTMTTFSSTGYGDIYPKTKALKIIVMILQFLLTVSILDYIVK